MFALEKGAELLPYAATFCFFSKSPIEATSIETVPPGLQQSRNEGQYLLEISQ